MQANQLFPYCTPQYWTPPPPLVQQGHTFGTPRRAVELMYEDLEAGKLIGVQPSCGGETDIPTVGKLE